MIDEENQNINEKIYDKKEKNEQKISQSQNQIKEGKKELNSKIINEKAEISKILKRKYDNVIRLLKYKLESSEKKSQRRNQEMIEMLKMENNRIQKEKEELKKELKEMKKYHELEKKE